MIDTFDALTGISAADRRALVVLHRVFSRPFNAELAASALNSDLAKTRRLLADLASGCWLDRVRQGLVRHRPDGSIGTRPVA